MVKIILINQHLLTPQESPVSYCALNPSCDLHEGNTYLKGISIEKIQWRRNRWGSAEMREWKRISLLRMSNILLRQFSVHCQSGNAICFPWSGLLVMLQRVVQVNLTEKCESRSSPAALFLLQGPTTWIPVGSFLTLSLIQLSALYNLQPHFHKTGSPRQVQAGRVAFIVLLFPWQCM